MGKVSSPHPDIEDGSEEDAGFQELHPGLARLFRAGGEQRRPDKRYRANRDELAKDFEQSEKVDESEARDHGDRLEEDEHHYRHVLISQIRKVYADTTASTPKRYSYDEWVYFLRLLGEDERDATSHKHAPELEDLTSRHDDDATRQKAFELAGQEGAYGKGNEKAPDKKREKVKWSWIGNRSPLMGDKEEAEWLLEKMFERLEESLRGEGKQKENQVKKETRKHHPSEQTRCQDGEEDGSSEETLARRESGGVSKERKQEEKDGSS